MTESDPPTFQASDPKRSEPFSASARVASFGHAFRGIGFLIRGEHNAWIHFAATLVVVGLGLLLEINRLEWAVIILAIGLVWSAEAFNTAIELLCDVVSAEKNAQIGRVKDVAAGAVLISALTAATVAVLVFGRRLISALL